MVMNDFNYNVKFKFSCKVNAKNAKNLMFFIYGQNIVQIKKILLNLILINVEDL